MSDDPITITVIDPPASTTVSIAQLVPLESIQATVISVNGHSGPVVLDADDLDEGATHKFLTSDERARLSTNIQDGGNF